MPLPEKRKGETHKEFTQRCMGDDVMVREFPDAGQRRAICEAQWKGRRRVSSSKPPEYLTFLCPLTVEAAGDGERKTPRFRMVAYTGGLMRIAGFQLTQSPGRESDRGFAIRRSGPRG